MVLWDISFTYWKGSVRKRLSHHLLLVFSFFPCRHFFWMEFQKLFSQHFIISYKGSMWPRSDSFLRHTFLRHTCFSIRNYPQVVIHDRCGTWHNLCTVTSIHNIQKSTRISQELRNKLVCGWQNIQGSKQRKNELISKKVWRKKKRKCSD